MNVAEFPLGRAAAFIDRDGVINFEREYVHKVADLELIPGVVSGMLKLQEAGYLLVVVTNQAGIARGIYTEVEYEHVTAHMHSLFDAVGIHIAGVYHCPHHPTAGAGIIHKDCVCRKPAPGLLLKAASDLNIDLSSSILIGDKESDIAAGRAAELRACILVRSGHEVTSTGIALADACVGDLFEAADWLGCGREIPGKGN